MASLRASAHYSSFFLLWLRMLSLMMGAVAAPVAYGSETVTSEPGGAAYHFVSHYTIDVNAPATAVWKRLIDVGSWMYEFDMIPVSGEPGQEGEVRRLYDGQDFLVEIIKAIPDELLVLANLPSSFNGERSTGIIVVSLNERDGTTTVVLTMSRRYTWDRAGPNPQRETRESPEFQERTRAMWNGQFLPTLKSLAES